MPSPLRVAAPFAVILLLFPTPSHAFSCDDLDQIASMDFTVLPGSDRPAPLNTKIRIQVGGHAKGLHFTLHDKSGTEIPSKQQFIARWGDSGVELTPAQPLVAGASYEVKVSAADQDTRSIGKFHVGKETDTAPPAGTAIREGKSVRVRIHTDGGMVQILHLRLAVGNVKDDHTPAAGLLFRVWELPDGMPAPDQPAKAWLLPESHDKKGLMLFLGQGYDLCQDANYPQPKGKGTLRLVVRAEDEAGNAGEPSEVVIDLAKVVKESEDWNAMP